MRLALALSFLFCLSSTSYAAEWFVQPGGGGNGSSSAPFGKIQDAINIAQAGDVVSVRPGTYSEALQTVRNGTDDKRITIRAVQGRGSVLVTAADTVLNVAHAYNVVDGLIIDAQYAAADAVRIRTAGHYFVLRNAEVRRTTRDAIDLTAPEGVLIENSLVHHSLNAANGRTDAHGIVAGAVKRLAIRGTEIHTFSGDAIQVDPGRSAPGWSDVTIEGCRLWLQPLPSPENGFAAGVVPGENAVDTKAALSLPRARLVIRDTVAYGFRNGLIGNMAAFNLKENIDATVDGVTVYDSEIAFRLRGASVDRAGALVGIRNAVVHSTATAYRYENEIDKLRIWNSTVGAGVTRTFQSASATATAMDVRNLLVLGSSLPAEASHPSNMAAGAESFTNAAAHNYTLVKGARAIDAGASIVEVSTDRQGTARPQGSAWDVGAYEYQQAPQVPSGGDGEIVLCAHPTRLTSPGSMSSKSSQSPRQRAQAAWRTPRRRTRRRGSVPNPSRGDRRVSPNAPRGHQRVPDTVTGDAHRRRRHSPGGARFLSCSTAASAALGCRRANSQA
jgi:hypothetical protein